MSFLEKDLEDIVFEAMNTIEGKEKLRSRGLIVNGKPFRQVEIGNYGRIDILTVSYYSNFGFVFSVYELKKDKIDRDALMQGCRYIEGIKQLFPDVLEHRKVSYNLILIGRDIDKKGSFVYLYNMMPRNVKIYNYSYDIDGLKFGLIPKTWCLSNPSFSDKITEISLSPGSKLLRNILKSTIQDDE